MRPQRLERTAAHCATPSVPSASKRTTVTIDEDRPLRFAGTYQERGARMLPLYAARIEDLGQGDFVKVDCAACHHVALLAPEFLLRLGCSPQTKVLDLKERVRCRGCGKRGRAAVSIKWRRQKRVIGLLPAPVKPSRRRLSFRPRQSGSTPP